MATTTSTHRPAGLLSEQAAAEIHAAFASRGEITRSAEVRGFVLGSLNLPGARVEHLDLSATDIRGSNLKRADVEHTSFVAARLQGADLSFGRFVNCTFRSAQLSGANLEGARFEGCDLRGVELDGANLRAARFSACSLQTASLVDAELSRARFHESGLSDVDLSGALLSRAVLPDCVVRRVQLDGVRQIQLTRTLVSELLRQHTEGDLERQKIALLVAERRDLCWDAWKEMAEDLDPALVAWAEEVFAGNPESGLAEAFAEGVPSATAAAFQGA